MKKAVALVALVLLAALVLYLSNRNRGGGRAGGDAADVVGFNNAMASATGAIADDARAFARKIKPAIDGDPGALDELRQADSALAGTVQRLKAEAGALKVPPGEAAKKFHGPAEKWTKIKALIAESARRSGPTEEAFRQAQRDYAREYGHPIEQPPAK